MQGIPAGSQVLSNLQHKDLEDAHAEHHRQAAAKDAQRTVGQPHQALLT